MRIHRPELTEGYWYFNDNGTVAVVKLERPTGRSPLYILHAGSEEMDRADLVNRDLFLGPVTLPTLP